MSCEEAAKSLMDVSQEFGESGRKQDELKQAIEDRAEEKLRVLEDLFRLHGTPMEYYVAGKI